MRSHRIPSLVLMGAALLLPAGAPPAGAAGPEDGYGLDARRIMEAVNARYRARINEPRTVEIDGTTTTRGLGQFDSVTVSEDIAFLQGDKARVEQIFSEVTVESGDGEVVFRGPGATRHVWTHDGEKTRVLYETPRIEALEGGTRVKGMVIHHDQIPQTFPEKFRQPLTRNEFDETFLEAKFYAYPAILDARTVYVLRSQQPIVANADSVILACAFWIDAESLELVRVEMDVQQSGAEADEPIYMTTIQETRATWGNPIAATRFELDFPEDVEMEDLTPAVLETLQESGFAAAAENGGTR